jgi:hypothetical protein
MERTTLSLEPPILKRIKDLCLKEGKSMRKVITELLALGLQAKKAGRDSSVRDIRWHSQPMGAKVDYSDKEDLYRVLDQR